MPCVHLRTLICCLLAHDITAGRTRTPCWHARYQTVGLATWLRGGCNILWHPFAIWLICHDDVFVLRISPQHSIHTLLHACRRAGMVGELHAAYPQDLANCLTGVPFGQAATCRRHALPRRTASYTRTRYDERLRFRGSPPRTTNIPRSRIIHRLPCYRLPIPPFTAGLHL